VKIFFKKGEDLKREKNEKEDESKE